MSTFRSSFWALTPTAAVAAEEPVSLIGFAAFSIPVLLATLIWETRRRRTQDRELRALAAMRENLQSALGGSGDGLWDWDLRQSTVVRMGIAEMLGYAPADIEPTANALYALVHPADRERVLRTIGQHLAGQSKNYEAEFRMRDRHGNWRWVLDRGRLLSRDAQGEPLRMAGTTKDISARKQMEDELRLSAAVIAHLDECVIITDMSFTIQSVNAAFLGAFGYTREELVGKDVSLINSTQHDAQFYEQIRERVLRDGNWRGELWQRRHDGSEMLVSLDVKRVVNLQGEATHCVGVINDITQQRRAENELRYLANYDLLTGLPNRVLFQERLQKALVACRQRKGRLALLFLDIDHFKHVNDSLGHAAGDLLLQQVAARLRVAVGEEVLVARLGGDEFTVLIDDVGAEVMTPIKQVIDSILGEFRAPFSLHRQDVGVSTSIGVGLYPEHGLDASSLLKCADTAMYSAKSLGRNTWQFYAPELQETATRRLQVGSALRQALERQELELHFQPRLALDRNSVAGFEALVRWRSGTLGAVPPGEFIAVAEDSGLIAAIGDWALREACQRAARWHAQGKTAAISVNLSARQFSDATLAARVQTRLEASALPADLLELEVTESVLLELNPVVLDNLAALRALGVKLALDDFGTGYSSFAYLKKLRFDTIKIDREFVRDLGNDAPATAIVTAIIELAHNLDMKVVAEGVEQSAQLQVLRALGCEEVQGYLVGAAVADPYVRPAAQLAVH